MYLKFLNTMTPRASILPAEFQQVEYIECTGSQWINTGITTTRDIGLKLHFSIVASGDGAFGVLKNPGRYGMGFYIGNNGLTIYYSSTFSVNCTNFQPSQYTEYILYFNYKNEGKVRAENTGGGTIGSIYTMPTMNTPTAIDFLLFASNNINVTKHPGMRIMYAEVTNGVDVVRKYYPCYQKANNTIGLYDILQGALYQNVGEGVFIKGGNV